MKLLFVCLGNICRSPAAEGVMQALVDANGLSEKIHCDSAGTNGLHDGELADERMRKHAKKRGHELTSISRRIRQSDFTEFDYILVMDDNNSSTIQRLKPDNCTAKIHRFTDFCQEIQADHVPDPYYGGADGFELVLDIVEDAANGLLEKIKEDL